MGSLGELLPFIGSVVFFIGLALLVIGAILIIAKRDSQRNKDDGRESGEKRRKSRAGGVVVVGPIPIIFGTDWKAILIAAVAAMLLIVAYLLLSYS